MGPRCDWVCLSKKCQQDGAATVYEDLPIATKVCPVCGSKRIQRLYNHAPGMIRSRSLNHVVDVAGSEAQLKKSDNTAARLKGAKQKAPALAVPMSQLAGTLGQFGMRANLDLKTGSRPNGAVGSHPGLAQVVGRSVRPSSVIRDTEHAIRKVTDAKGRVVGGEIVKT